MRVLLLVIDGLGDIPIPELGGRTPLEAAKTPNLDKLAQEGVCGMVDTFYFPEQKYPRSDTTHLALLGYDPERDYLGRGPYEVAGIHMNLEEGDIALRGNFGSVDENLKIVDRRSGRIKETEDLVESLKGKEIEGVKFLIKKSYGHRVGIVMKSDKELSSQITNGDPHQTGVKVNKIRAKNDSAEAEFTAKVLNRYLEEAHEILKSHPLNKKREEKGLLPGNYLLVRGAGRMRNVVPFKEKFDMKAACIAGGALYKGIGKILGMDLINVKGDTGLPSTDLKAKFKNAARVSKKYDFVFVHVKPTDNLAEDGNFKGKKEFIERIDKNITPIMDLNDTLVVITADHSTCCPLKRHCVNPVPVLVFGKEKDSVSEFGERTCEKGALGQVKQTKLVDLIFKLKS